MALVEKSIERGALVIESLPFYKEALRSFKPPANEFIERLDTQATGRADNDQTVLDVSNLPDDSLSSFPSTFPTVKRIPRTQFIVDGFRNAGPWSVSYFLSHFHSDHYTGITNLWNKGLIFCSEITARLVKQSLQVPEAFVVSLPMGTTVLIDGCEVALVDANHCPGAVQFLFGVPGEAGETLRYVHCGDMRYHPFMKSEPCLCDYVGADAVFLDTTYCNPKYVFPSQKESVDYVAGTVKRLMGADSEAAAPEEEDDSVMEDRVESMDEEEEDVEPLEKASNAGVTELAEGDGRSKKDALEDEEDDLLLSQSGPVEGKSTLFLISTYVIGKEKILTAVAKRCNCLIYVTEKKLSVLKCLNLENIEVFTTNPAATNVHVVQWSFLGETWPYFRPNFVKMEKAMRDRGYQKVVGFVPTGWTYELKKKTFSVKKKGPFEIHLVPYSEHSNYEELREYVGFIRPKEIIPTVGLDAGGMESKAVATMRKHFRNLVDETASKRNFLKGFSRKPQEDNSLAINLSNDVAPKAIFGRAARKRKRDGDEGLNEHDDTNQATRSTTMMLDDAGEQSKTDKAMNEFELDENQMFEFEPDEKDITKGDWELAVALSKTFDAADSVNEKDVGPRSKSPTGSEDVVNRKSGRELFPVDVAYCTPPDTKPGSNNSGQTKSNQPIKSSIPQRSPAAKSKSSGRQQTKAQRRQKKPATSKKATKTSVNAPISKKAIQSPKSSAVPFQKAKQSSIFSFFKKSGEEPSSTQSIPVPSTEQSMMLAGTAPDLTSNVSARAERAGPSSRQSLTDLNKEADEYEQDMNKWADEYEQLASILDGNLSRELAHTLLEKAGGDVGVALDLFYSNEGTVQDSKSPEARAEDLLNSTDPKSAGGASERDSPVEDKQMVRGGEVERTYVGVSEQIRPDVANLASSPAFYKSDVPKALEDVSCEENPPPVSPVTIFQKPNGVKAENGIEKMPTSEAPIQSERYSRHKAGIAPERKTEPASPQPAPDKGDAAMKKKLVEKKECSVAVPVNQFSPIEHACWEPGEAAPYMHLARAFDLVEQEKGRLRTADMLCNMFRSLLALSPDAVLPAVYLTTNRLAPDFESVDLNIGGSIVSTAVGEVAGVSRAKLREMYTSMGDLGDVAQACRQTQSILRLPPPLRICQVFSTLKQISKESGGGSGARKKDLVLSLLRACREKEMKYIVRTLVQNMRIGAMMKTVLSALAQAVVLHHSFPANKAPNEALAKLKPKFQEAAIAVVEAYNFLPNLDLLVPTLVKDGVAALSANISISPGTPIKPMLAKITNGIPELLKRFEGQSFTCEYKYDGQRAQIHMLPDGSFRIFSRNCEDTTGRFPDVTDIVRDAAREDLTSFIIDAEVVAVDRENDNKLMAFQHLSTRERGSRDGGSVNLQNIKVSVCVFVFDIMYANKESLVKRTFRERRKCMHHWFPNIKPGHFGYASQLTIEPEDDPLDTVSSSQKVEGFLEETFAASCEGLMAKALDADSNYMASKRSDSWLKIKRDYMDGLNDSLDLVPIGAWYGNGRKAGWYSPFLLACYDPEREEYQSVCRVMSGFTDVFYKEMKEFYSGDRILPKKPTYYQTGEECNVWFTPELVWEIRGADFTVSPVHQAAVGLIHPSRGISMRFPRYIRSRPDKNPEISSSPSDIAELFHQQTRKLDIPGSKRKAAEKSGSPDES